MSRTSKGLRNNQKPTKLERRRLQRMREKGEICPEAWLERCRSTNQFFCPFCKRIDWAKARAEGDPEHIWGTHDWENLKSLKDHVRYRHQCDWCGIRFINRQRKVAHLAEFHGYDWGFPVGIKADNDYVISAPGWEPPKTLPKTVEEFYNMIRPLILLHIPGAGAQICMNEPDIDPIKGWHPPEDPSQTPLNVADCRAWLQPLCAQMMEAEWPELALEGTLEELASQRRYAEIHWDRVAEFLTLQRYGKKRMADLQRRAELLSVALADSTHSAAYIIQRYEVANPVRRKV